MIELFNLFLLFLTFIYFFSSKIRSLSYETFVQELKASFLNFLAVPIHEQLLEVKGMLEA